MKSLRQKYAKYVKKKWHKWEAGRWLPTNKPSLHVEREKQHNVLVNNLEHIPHPRDHYPSPTKYYHVLAPDGSLTEFQKDISPPSYQTSSLGWERWQYDLWVPWAQPVFCKMSFFERNSAVWKSMKVNKTFYKSMRGGFLRSIVNREGKFTCRVSFQGEWSAASSKMHVVQCNQPVTQWLLGSLRKRWQIWAQCCALLLACWALRDGYKQIILGE